MRGQHLLQKVSEGSLVIVGGSELILALHLIAQILEHATLQLLLGERRCIAGVATVQITPGYLALRLYARLLYLLHLALVSDDRGSRLGLALEDQ